jgi:quercetin 2,3-dioxygenase
MIDKTSNQLPPAARAVDRIVRGVETSDGAGVRLTRVLTQDLQRRLDPFLMLDAFRSDRPDDYIGGFPDHPHRGFETVTYMLAGRMRHHDSAGNHGLLEAGGAQWMTAGSGLIHSELPQQEEGLMEGFQLWVNLPASRKMSPPGYRDIPAAAIPEYRDSSGTCVRVIAGQHAGVKGAVERPDTEPIFLDIHLPADGVLECAIPPECNAFVYCYRGGLSVGDRPVNDREMAILANDGAAVVRIRSSVAARAIVVAGRPLREPIVQYGPFVMNTTEQIRQAISDYQQGLFNQASVQALPA